MTTLAMKRFSIMIFMFALTLAITCTGAFAISVERHEKAKTSRLIAAAEMKIKQLKRDNEELTVKIAEQENPVWLSSRAGSRLCLPKSSGSVVWAYENYEGGRVEFSGTNPKTVSFKIGNREGNNQ